MKHFILFIFIGIFTLAYKSNAQPLTSVYPQPNIQLLNVPIQFQWNQARDAISYDFKLSTDSLFTNIIFQTNIINNYYTHTSSLSNSNYYWKITANFVSLPPLQSEIFKFSYFTPLPNSRLKAWYSADTGVVITSGVVSQWTDLSGNSYSLTQTTVGNRPLKVENAINSKSIIRFDGVNDNLNVSFGQTVAQPTTSFVLWKANNAGSCINGVNEYHGLVSNSDNKIYLMSGSTNISYSKTLPFNYLLHTSTLNGLNSNIRENGTLKISGNAGNTGLTGLRVGNRFNNSLILNGDIAEILFYDTVISNNQKSIIETYFFNKYAPPVSLGYDISLPYSLCDTALVGANKSWFTSWLWNTGETTSTIRVSKSGKYWVRATNIFGIVSSDTILVNYEGQLLLPDSTICLGDTLTHTYSSANSYIISWSNGNIGSTFTTTQAGNYTVTITDSQSCSFQDSFVVAIDSFPSRNLINSDTIICSGNTITANSIAGTSSILWTPGNETTLSKTIYNSGTYYITAQNSRACFIHDSIQIQIKGTSPNPLFEWTKLCSRDTILFTDLSYPADSVASWQWNINNGFSSNIKNPKTVFDTSGTYQINFSIASAGNCSKDSTVIIHVNKKPTANFSYLNPCPLVPTPFTNLSDLNIGYTLESNHWYIDSDLASTEINPSLSFPASQSYNVSLRVQSTDFCSDSVTQTINIPASYPQPTTFSTISPSNNSILSNPTVLFTWNSSVNAQYYKLEVSRNSNFIPILNSATQVASNFPSQTLTIDTGAFYWRVIAYNPCIDSITSETQTFNILTPLIAKPVLWFAADSGVVISAGKITQWNDLSGYNNHAIQSTIANQPIRVSSNSVLNNKPSINFDGANDNFIINNSCNIGSVFIISNWGTSATVFPNAVSILGSALTHSKFILFSGEQSTSNIYTGASSLFTNNIKINTNSSNSFSPLSTYKLVYGKVATSSVQYTSLQIAGQTSTAGRYWNGNIAEIIAFDTVLSISDQNNIYTYLSNKYAPSVSLGYDITVPYKLCDTTLVGANKLWLTKWLWSTGDTTSTIKVNKTGNYWVRATNIFGMISSDTIFVNYPGQQTYNNATICLGDTLTYTYTKNFPYTVSWSNGNTGSTFKTTQAGNYSMTLDDNEGCQYNTSFSVAIDSFPAKNILISDTAFCSGNKINVIPGSGLTQILWTPDNDTTSFKTIYFPGQYYTRSTNARECINYDSISVSINGSASYPLFSWSKLCSRDTIQFTDLSYPADSIASWNWTINNGLMGSIQNPSTIFDTSGNYTLNLNLVSHSGCENDTTVTIHVNKKPTANFSYLNPCPMVPTPFTNLSDLNIGYTLESNLWYIDNDLASTEINPSLSFAASQAYNVSLRVQSTDFCSDSVTQTINIPASYPQPTTFSTISPSNNAILSQPTVLFTWNPSANAQYYKLEVSKNSDFIPILNSATQVASNFPTHTLTLDTGTFYWRVIAYNPCLDSITSETQTFNILTPLIAKPVLWFAADSGVVISAGKITQWNDLSGYNNHAIQSTVNNQPILVSSNSILNNKPTINFDGTNDNFIINNSCNIGSLFIISNWGTSATVFPNAVSMIGSTVTHSKYILLSGEQNTINIFTGAVGLFGNNIKINNNSSSIYSPLSTYKLVYGKVASNSVQYTSLQIAGQTSSTGRYWNGNIAEIIAFDTVLTSQEQNNVYTYLSNKYAPSVSLGYDITVPYKLCDTTLLGANKPWFTNWLWSTGDTTSTIKVNKTGNYWVRAANIFGMISSDTIFVNYPGQQTFNNTTICLGDTLTYTYTKNFPYTITWSNGNTGSTFKTTQAGNYSMTLDDNEGCQFNTSFSVAIDSFPAKNILITDTAFCSGNKINVIPGSGLTQILWTPDNDTTSFKTIYFPGQYYTRATNVRGCINYDSISVSISGSAPYPLFNWSKLCSRDTIQFTDLSYPADSIATWSWTIDNGFAGNNQNPSTVFDTSGNYMINLNLVSHSGCENDTTVTIHVNKKPTANFSYLNPCPIVPTPFTNLSDLNNGYTLESNLWYINSDLASNEINPSLSFAASQAYNVSLRVQSTDFCSDSITQTINIPASYPQPTTFSTISPLNNAILSQPTVLFTWNPSTNTQYYKIEVSKNSDFIPILNSHSLVADNFPSLTLTLDTGAYFWRVIAYNPCLDSVTSETQSFLILSPLIAKPILWFAADSGVVISAGKITQWNDLSGHNNHAIQSTVTNQPILVSSNSILNNKPTINFDGTNDNFIINNSCNIGSLFIISNWGTSATVFPNAVSMIGSANSHSKPIIFSGEQSTSNLYTGSVGLFTNNIKINNNSSYTYSPFSTYKLVYGRVATNSIQYTSIQIAGQTSITGRYWNGNIAEIIAFDTVLTSQEQNDVYTYLSNKYAPPVSLGYDITIPYKLCDTILVGANKPWFTNWLWSTGDTNSTINVNQTGNYWVRATNIFGMISSDTIFVNYPGQQAFNDSIICLGDTITYTYTKNFPYTITWSNGDIGTTFKTTQAGTYTMTLLDSTGCDVSTDFTISLDSLPVWVSLGSDLSFCSGEILTPLIQNQDLTTLTYLWMDHSPNSNILVNYGGNYSVSVTNQRGCVGIDSIDISIQGSIPMVSFDAPGVCIGNSSIFTDQSYSSDGSNIVSWSWNFGNDSISDVQNPQITYSESGIYQVTLLVVNENLCSAVDTSQIVVYSKPVVHFSPLEACAQSPVQFTDLSTDTYQIDQWFWDFGDQFSTENSSDLQNPIHQFDTVGDYQVKLISKSIFGCTDSITYNFSIKPIILADFTASKSCFGTPTWFYNSSETNSWNPIMKYKWEYSNLLNDSLPVSSYLFNAPGFYDVKHTIYTLNGCSNSITKSVKVSNIPTAGFSNPETCLNTTYVINDESIIDIDTIQEIKWFVNDLFYSEGNQAHINFNESDTFQIKQVVISSENCSDTLIKPVIVHAVPTSSFTYSYDQETVGYLIHFANTSTGANSYLWDFGTGQTSTVPSPSNDFGEAGNYNVVLISENQYGCSDTSNQTVLVSEPSMDLSLLNASFINENGYLKTELTIANMGNRNVFDIWIDIQAGNSNSRELWTGIIRPGEVIQYPLRTYTPIPPYEDLKFACATIHSDLFPDERTFTNNQYCMSNSSDFQIIDTYPVPATDKISLIISCPSDGKLSLTISRPDGRLMIGNIGYDITKGINHISIPISALPSGVYFIHAEYDGKRIVRKFVVI